MGRAMLSKSFIQFSVDGRVCVLSLLFDLRPNYGGGNEDNGDLLQKVTQHKRLLRKEKCAHTAYSVSPTLQQATADLCLSQRLLDTHGQVWVSLLWRHFSFLLGEYKFLLIKYQREYNKNIIFLLRK